VEVLRGLSVYVVSDAVTAAARQLLIQLVQVRGPG
jgi:hypothetical protein